MQLTCCLFRIVFMTSKTIHDGYQKPSNTLHTAAGASSSFFTRLLSQPFDVIKIRFQVITNIFN